MCFANVAHASNAIRHIYFKKDSIRKNGGMEREGGDNKKEVGQDEGDEVMEEAFAMGISGGYKN